MNLQNCIVILELGVITNIIDFSLSFCNFMITITMMVMVMVMEESNHTHTLRSWCL